LAELFGDFDTDEIMEVPKVEEAVKVPVKSDKIQLVLDNNNENIFFRTTGNRTFLEFNKKNIDLDLGQRIFEEYGYVKPKRQNIFGVSAGNDNSNITQPEEKKKIKFITSNSAIEKKPSDSKIVHHRDKGVKEPRKHTLVLVQPAGLENKIDWDLIMNDKARLPKLKIKFKEYFNSPKCNICDMIGITLDEFNRISGNKQAQIDIATLDYILLNCSMCRTFVHRNCLKDLKTAPVINYKERNVKEWICERCNESMNSQCVICYSDRRLQRRPYFIKLDSNNNWAHYLCYLWMSLEVEGMDIEEKLYNVKNVYQYGECQYCMSDTNE
jgi:hypothetical protein